MTKSRYLLLGVFLLTSVAFGQSSIGGATLNGTVTDPSGAAIAGAKVTANNASTGLTRTTATTEAGLYDFPNLPVGTYDLTIEKQGFSGVKRSGIQLSVGAVVTINAPLQIGTTQETVNVTAETPVVETTRSATTTTVTQQEVEDLPVNGRNILDVSLASPGVVKDPTRTGDYSFAGQRGTANSLLVDGSDANNVFFGQSTGRAGTGRSQYSFSQDAIQEFQVNTNSYGAEIGRAGGGVLNVITKSGTNDIHGTAFEFFRDKALNANKWENNRNKRPKPFYHFNQFGGNIGGPVIKNKVFFFFDYDGQRNTSPNTVFLQIAPPSDALSQQAAQSLQKYVVSYSQALNNDVYLGKVDWNIGGNQRLSVRYNANRFVGQNFENGGAASSVEHTGNSNVTTDNVAGNHTLTIGTASVLESRFVYTRDNEPGFANSAAPEAIIRQNSTTVLNIGRNNFSPRYTNAKTYQWAENFSHIMGGHSLKFGVDMDFQKIANFFPGNFSGSFTFNSYADFAANRPFSLTQAFAGAGTNGPLSQPNVNEYSFYAQDSWRVTDRLTLNYGVRYDIFKYAQPLIHNPDPGLAALHLDTAKINLDDNNLAPRFGFAYRLDDAGRMAIRGGYGVYYGRTPSILTGTAITNNGIQVQTYTLLSNIPAYPNILSAPPTLNRTPDIFLFAPDYVQPLTHQWSFNFERQVGRDIGVTIGYLGVRGEHLTRTRDINFLPEVPVQGTIAGVGPVTFYRHLGRLNPNFGRISVFDSGADSIYHGGFIQLTKRFSRDFQVQTSYTYSKVIDDAPDFTSVVIPSDDPKNAQDTLQPNLERGLGIADVRHRFVFSGLWQINYANSLQNRVLRALLRGFELSSIATMQSGRPYTISVGGDPNNDGNTRSDRPPGVGRNTVEGPNFLVVDMRVTREIPLYAERVKMKLIFEAFNLTNRANYSSLLTGQYNFSAATNTFTPASGFLTPSTTFDARILQLAAKITF
jgi:outer membrane receptor protein involved in Fe transport